MQEATGDGVGVYTGNGQAAEKNSAAAHTRSMRQTSDHFTTYQSIILAARTRSDHGTDGGDSGMKGGADNASVSTPAGVRRPGNELESVGMPKIDKRDLGCGIDNGERSTGMQEARS